MNCMSLRRHLTKIPRVKYFWFLMVNVAVGGLASTMLGPFIPVFLHKSLGISVGAVSFLYFVSGILGTLSVFLMGWLVDRYGRKWIYVFGNLSVFIVPAALTRITNLAQALPLVSLSGVMDSAARTSQTTIIADQVDESNRNTAYGVSRIVGNAPWIIAPIIGGVILAEESNFPRLFTVSAIIGAVSVLLFIALVPESRRAGLERPRLPRLGVLRDRDLLVLCVASLFSMLFYSQFYTLLPIFATQVKGLSDLEVGLLFSTSGATVVALQLPTSTWLERIPKQTGYIIGIIILACGITSIALAPTFHWLLVSVVLMTLGENMFFPISLTIVTEMAPEAERGTYVGAFNLFLNIGANLSPLVGGMVWQLTGNPFLPWLLSPVYAAISVGLALFYRLHPLRGWR